MIDKHQKIIIDRVLPEIKNIFPNEAKYVFTEKESVKVIYMIPLPDDPTKPIEKKYKRFIIRFTICLIDDWLDGEKYFHTVLKRIYDRVQSEYLTFQSEKILNDKESRELIISNKTLNLIN